MKILVSLLMCLMCCCSAFADQPTTVLAKVRQTKEYTVETPFIDGANDESFQSSANGILADAAEKMLKTIGKRGRVDFDVTLNRPSLVSILLKGRNGSLECYDSVNIDLTTGREFSLSEFYFDSDERNAVLGEKTDKFLLKEEGVCLQDEKHGAFSRCVPYATLMPMMRIGEAGRILSIWKLTRESDGKVLRVRTGSMMAFRLAGNPSTGFKWMDEITGGAPMGLYRVGSSFSIPQTLDQNQNGTPGVEFIFLTAQKPGTYDLKFTYRRPWQKMTVTDDFKMTVVVE